MEMELKVVDLGEIEEKEDESEEIHHKDSDNRKRDQKGKCESKNVVCDGDNHKHRSNNGAACADDVWEERRSGQVGQHT